MAAPKDFRALRRVHPTQRVLVDLRTLYPPPPHFRTNFVSGGLRVNRVVDGTLSMWGMTEDGYKIAYVSYQLEFGRDQVPMTQWMPVEALKLID